MGCGEQGQIDQGAHRSACDRVVNGEGASNYASEWRNVATNDPDRKNGVGEYVGDAGAH